MFPTMYANYSRTLGAAAGPVVVVDGVQKLTSKDNAKIAGYLESLYFGPVVPTPVQGAHTMVAQPCDQAKQAGATSCDVTAHAALASRVPGSSVVVDYASASPTGVTVTVVTGSEAASSQEILRQLASQGSNLALFEPDVVTKKDKEEKDKGATLLVGAGAGAAAGFFTLGPVGAAAGAAAGALLANWLAA